MQWLHILVWLPSPSDMSMYSLSKDNGILSRIISEMTLPSKKSDKGADSHYRCAACLQVREDE
jgi:hypothetical protein